MRTPFYPKYLEYEGSQVVELFDIAIPWAFASLEEEVKLVRERAGFIDYSVNNLRAIVGKDALSFVPLSRGY
jgi:glycine cleavage system aminomethyltransferase T